MAWKLLAAADIHLGRSSTQLSSGQDWASTRYIWQAIVDLACREAVDAVLLSGDIIDRENGFFEALRPLQEGFALLGSAQIPTYIVAGNHDAEVLPQLLAYKQWKQVHLLGKEGSWECQILEKEGEKLQILGWSFPRSHYSEDPAEDLDTIAVDPAAPCVGLLHGDLYDKQSKYAPVDLDKLRAGPAQAWVMGHIHKPDQLAAQAPSVHYPGSPQALSPKEQGAHGVMLMELESGGAMRHQFVPLSPVLYESLDFDLSQIRKEEAFRKEFTEGLEEASKKQLGKWPQLKYLSWDIVLTGNHPDFQEVERWTEELGQHSLPQVQGADIQIRKIHLRLQPAIADIEEWARESSPAGQLAQTVLQLEREEDSPFLEKLISQWLEKQKQVLQSKNFAPLREREQVVYATRQEARQALLEEGKRLLLEFQQQRKPAAL